MTSPTPSPQVENGIRPEALQGSGDRTSPYPWTPGPWHCEATLGGAVTVYATRSGDDDKILVSVAPFGPLSGRLIDGQLIAAAPDLFEALLEAREAVAEEAASLRDSCTVHDTGAVDEEALPEINRLESLVAKIDAALSKAPPPNPASNKSRGTGES